MRFLSRNGLMQLLGIKPKNAKMTIRTKLTDQQRLDALEKKRIEDQIRIQQQIAELRMTCFRGERTWASLRGSSPSPAPKPSSRSSPAPDALRSDDLGSTLATSMLYASAISSASSDYSSPPAPAPDPSPSFSSGGGGDFSGGGSSGSWE